MRSGFFRDQVRRRVRRFQHGEEERDIASECARDTFVRLKIDGCFDATPNLYDRYVRICNQLILHTREVNITTFLVSVEHVDSTSDFKEFRKMVESASQPIRDADAALWTAVLKILVENSPLLQIAKLVPMAMFEMVEKFPRFIDSFRFTRPVGQYVKVSKYADVSQWDGTLTA